MVIKAIIFDVDGTLAETEEVHRQAFNETFAENGLDWHWDIPMYAELLKTTGGKERMAAYQNAHLPAEQHLEEGRIAELHKLKTARYGELVASGTLSLRKGIRELIEDARENGVRVAVATTTNRPNVDRLSEACFHRPAGEVFEVIAAGDEVRAKKPAPDVFELALRRLDLPPHECVGLEDSRNGLLSCTGAGVPCIVSPGHYTLGSDFSEAHAVIECFSQIDSISKLKGLFNPT